MPLPKVFFNFPRFGFLKTSDLGRELLKRPADNGKRCQIFCVTVPLKNYRAVPVEPLAGKIVIDTNNYYPQRDGHIPALDNESTTTSELLQTHLPTSKVVKAFNHIYAAQLTTDGQPAGTIHCVLESGEAPLCDKNGDGSLRVWPLGTAAMQRCGGGG